MITRRKFVVSALSFSAVTSTSPALLLAQSDLVGSENFESSDLVFSDTGITLFPGTPLNETRAKAQELLNQNFEILLGETEIVEVRLIDIVDSDLRLHTDNYSLVFHTTWTSEIAEEIHTFQHPEMGQFSLYLHQIDQEGIGRFYAASISHLVNIGG